MTQDFLDAKRLAKVARTTGVCLLLLVAVGFLNALTFAADIDVNLTGDIAATASSMLQAEVDGRARGHLALLSFCLQIFVAVGMFLILGSRNVVITGWALALSVGSAAFALMGGLVATNGAVLASHAAWQATPLVEQREVLAAMQATMDHSSFHMTLVLGCLANAAFFFAFLESGRLPKWLAGWGIFASLFVASAVVGRDFVAILGSDSVTVAFLGANLLAMLATGVYLWWRGARLAHAGVSD